MRSNGKDFLVRLFLVSTLAGGLAFALTGCNVDFGKAEADQAEDEDKEEAVPVEVAALGRGSIEALLRFSTNLDAESQVEVQAEAARRVVDLRVEEGDEVGRGLLLLELQDDEQQTTLAKVESELRKVEREYDRQTRLHEQGLISEEAFNQATFDVEQLKLRQKEARQELSYTQVKAPIRGVITRRMVNLGDQVTVNQSLFEIVDFDSIVARIFVPEKELERLEVGQPARITAPSLADGSFRGKIERISPVVDPSSGTVKVTVAIPRSEGLRPGLYVDVQLVTATHDEALLVPKRALVYDSDQVFVYRLKEGAGEPAGTRVEKVRVRPLLEDKEFVEPGASAEGASLEAGDRLVVAGQVGLKDGALVRLVGQGTAGPAASDPAAEAAR